MICKEIHQKKQWVTIVEEIFLMEKLTYKLRLQETQLNRKWGKLTLYKTQNKRH